MISSTLVLEESDHRHRGLLCTRCKRPCRRNTTDKADKFPPPHGRLRHERTGHTKHSTWKGFAYVRFGSEADICSAKWHVRFTPKSGHVQCSRRCPLRAKSGHRAPNKIFAYTAESTL